jgi:hypothetical protein
MRIIGSQQKADRRRYQAQSRREIGKATRCQRHALERAHYGRGDGRQPHERAAHPEASMGLKPASRSHPSRSSNDPRLRRDSRGNRRPLTRSPSAYCRRKESDPSARSQTAGLAQKRAPPAPRLCDVFDPFETAGGPQWPGLVLNLSSKKHI